MFLEQDLIPILWAREIGGGNFDKFKFPVPFIGSFAADLQNRIFLLQEITEAGLNFSFTMSSTGVYSSALTSLFQEAADPHPQTKRFLENASLKDESKGKVEVIRRLITPPEVWTGDCEPIWVKGEALILHLSPFCDPEQPAGFRDRIISFVSSKLPNLPQPLIVSAYDRLSEFDAFKKSPQLILPTKVV